MSASRQAAIPNHPAAAAIIPNPLAYPRKNKWLQDDGHLVGRVRRKNEKDRSKYNVLLDKQYAEFAPENWSDLLPPLTKKKKEKKEEKEDGTNSSSSSASEAGKGKKGGALDKLMFWKKKGQGKGKGKEKEQAASGAKRG